jgi:hypothetical protein
LFVAAVLALCLGIYLEVLFCAFLIFLLPFVKKARSFVVVTCTTTLSVFPGMPDSEHVDRWFLDFIAYLVMAYQNAANLTWLELVKRLSDVWVLFETHWRSYESLDDFSGSLLVDRCQKVVKPC